MHGANPPVKIQVFTGHLSASFTHPSTLWPDPCGYNWLRGKSSPWQTTSELAEKFGLNLWPSTGRLRCTATWGKQTTGCQYQFWCTNVSRQEMKHRHSDKTGMRSVSRCHYRRSEIVAESLAGLKEVVSHPKETRTLIRKTAPQNFKEHELKVSW